MCKVHVQDEVVLLTIQLYYTENQLSKAHVQYMYSTTQSSLHVIVQSSIIIADNTIQGVWEWLPESHPGNRNSLSNLTFPSH